VLLVPCPRGAETFALQLPGPFYDCIGIGLHRCRLSGTVAMSYTFPVRCFQYSFVLVASIQGALWRVKPLNSPGLRLSGGNERGSSYGRDSSRPGARPQAGPRGVIHHARTNFPEGRRPHSPLIIVYSNTRYPRKQRPQKLLSLPPASLKAV
jgi:hypothetical protein